ncbi:MAG: ECF transporter S component [Clostridiales bacterium]|nr:ECF transporter S component [Clostridiales bacterium]
MSKQNQKTKTIALLGILSALIILMAFTPLGYLRVGLISISFLMIPVAVGAVARGPVSGAVLGTVFGFTSFIQCFGMDAFGTFLAQKNVFYTFVMCVVCRALAGFIAGIIFKGISAVSRNVAVNGSICGLSAALLNTVLFVGSMLLLFGKTTISDATNGALSASENVIKFFAAFVGVNAIWEAVAAFILTGAIALALYKAKLITLPSKAEKEAS